MHGLGSAIVMCALQSILIKENQIKPKKISWFRLGFAFVLLTKNIELYFESRFRNIEFYRKNQNSFVYTRSR